jgi:N-acetylmuramoyl-L-alanine amidase
MRTIKHIVLHCTATQPNAEVAAIQKYWKEVKNWSKPGYHLIIKEDGTYERLAPDSEITNGVAGHNKDSIHISYVGGIDQDGFPKDTRTAEQRVTMLTLVRTMRKRYPEAMILGHTDFPNVSKACPSFSVAGWLTEVGIESLR